MFLAPNFDHLKFMEALTCPACLCPFNEVPKILPRCGHSMCKPCLEQWMLASGSVASGRVNCPICKSRTPLNLSRQLRKYFQRSEYIDYDDRQYEAECVINYLVDKFIPNNPTMTVLYKLYRPKLFWRSRRDRVRKVLKRLLQCPVCDRNFDQQPRMMPSCLHSICVQCLQKAYKKSDEQFGFVCCPICWSSHKFHEITDDLYDYDGCDKPDLKSDSAKGPPNEKLANNLPFDDVLHWIVENAHVVRENFNEDKS